MKRIAACVALASALACADASAQSDAMERLRACSALPAAERTACLEKLSHDIGPAPPSPAPAPAPTAAETPRPAENWVFSETTSPFDYSPIAIASASADSSPDGVPLQLSIQCRSGGTELVLASTALKPRGETYVLAYLIDNGEPVPLAGGMPASERGVAVKGDVARLLASLPDHGSIAFRITARQGATLEGRYALAGLNGVLKRLAGPCKWPK